MISIIEDSNSIQKNLYNSIVEMVLSSNTPDSKKLVLLKKKKKQLDQQNELLTKNIKFKRTEINHYKKSLSELENKIAIALKKLNVILNA